MYKAHTFSLLVAWGKLLMLPNLPISDLAMTERVDRYNVDEREQTVYGH